MRNLMLLVALTLCFHSILMAQVNRGYYQKLVLADGMDITQLVTNSSTTHCPAYRVTGTLMGAPVDMISSDNNHENVRICRQGNGNSVPYYASLFIQLGGFDHSWVVGEILHVDVEYLPTAEHASWDFTIPAGTSTINITNPTQIIPPGESFPLTIQGTITSSFPVDSVTVHCTGQEDWITDATGDYQFTVQPGQHYDISATKQGFTFNGILGVDVTTSCLWFQNLFMRTAKPYAVGEPSPANGAVNVDWHSPTLSWNYIHHDDYTDPSYCMLFFPTICDEYVVVYPVAPNTYSYPTGVNLQPFTMFHWSVIPCYTDDTGSFIPDSVQVWTFSTADVTANDENLSPSALSPITAYPNPSKCGGDVRFALNLTTAEAGMLTVYNARGQEIVTMHIKADRQVPIWNGRDHHHRMCAAGIYVYALDTNQRHVTGKLVKLR